MTVKIFNNCWGSDHLEVIQSGVWEPLSYVESLGVPGKDLGWVSRGHQGAGTVAPPADEG